MKKLSYKRLKKVEAVLLIAGFAIALWGRVYDSVIVMLFGIGVIGSAFVIHFLHHEYMFCPHCGRYLYRNYGDYCQKCGGLIDRESE